VDYNLLSYLTHSTYAFEGRVVGVNLVAFPAAEVESLTIVASVAGITHLQRTHELHFFFLVFLALIFCIRLLLTQFFVTASRRDLACEQYLDLVVSPNLVRIFIHLKRGVASGTVIMHLLQSVLAHVSEVRIALPHIRLALIDDVEEVEH